MILKVLWVAGNVLLPVETTGHVLELILHLESVSVDAVGGIYRIVEQACSLSNT